MTENDGANAAQGGMREAAQAIVRAINENQGSNQHVVYLKPFSGATNEDFKILRHGSSN